MSKRLDKDERTILMIIAAIIIFSIVFTFNMIYRFFTHCIIEWPPRMDFAVCWDEQKEPAKEKAAEIASPFLPF